MKVLTNKLFHALILVSLLVAWGGTGTAQAYVFTRCYVNAGAGGLNNGTSWANAYTDLQSALGIITCSPIWVAAGTYKPTPTTDRTISFNILPGRAVYGGFAGTETLVSQRNPTLHVTILSADIGTPGVNTDNSYWVVSMDGTSPHPVTPGTILDGFTITGGYANGSNPDSFGGGLFCDGDGSGGECSPTLQNLIFSGNYAIDGGAIYNGGNNSGASSPGLTNITFSGNHAGGGGGAIYNDGENSGTSSPTLINVTFSGNTATSYGGAIYNDGYGGGTSSPTLTNVTFSGNTAANGGALFNDGFTSGGTSSPSLTNVTFRGNTASVEGGAILNIGLNTGNSSPTLTNVTFSLNSAPNGGAIYNDARTGGASTPSLTNLILWGDTASTSGPEIYNNSSAAPTLHYSVIQGGCPSGSTCTSIMTADPKLGPLQNNGGSTQTMALGAGSSAIDTAKTAACPGTDQRGYARGLDGFCDVGAYEFLFADVPDSYWASSFINRLYSAGITGGCSSTPLDYCPGSNVTRDQMAVFLEKGLHGSSFNPPVVSLTFTDTSSDFAKYWIEALKSNGITSGCGGGMYCPYANVTRAEMAVFLLKAEHGSSYTPPAATGTVFTDVAKTYWAAGSIEQLYHEGITGGCILSPLQYCPDSSVTRDQMAVFLVKAFGLP